MLTKGVGVGVGTGLHLPALPALTMAWISVISSARLKSSNSSIKPFQAKEGFTTFLPMTKGSLVGSMAPVTAMFAFSTPSTYIRIVAPSYVAAACWKVPTLQRWVRRERHFAVA